MKFYSLYKTEGNWSNENKHPLNHLAIEENEVAALCGKKDVQWMGGIFIHRNGNWYSEDVKIPLPMFEKGTCKKCLKKANDIIQKQTNNQ